MSDSGRSFMNAVNDPAAHAPPGFHLEPVRVEPKPVASSDDVGGAPALVSSGMLDYRPPQEDRRRLRRWVHASLGFVTCLVVTAAANLAGGFAIIIQDTT